MICKAPSDFTAGLLKSILVSVETHRLHFLVSLIVFHSLDITQIGVSSRDGPEIEVKDLITKGLEGQGWEGETNRCFQGGSKGHSDDHVNDVNNSLANEVNQKASLKIFSVGSGIIIHPLHCEDGSKELNKSAQKDDEENQIGGRAVIGEDSLDNGVLSEGGEKLIA